MYKKNILNYIFILIVAYLATSLRYVINNNFIISVIGSFFFGFVIARTSSKYKKSFLLCGFCSCFTSFSGFIYFLYEIINQGEFLKLFIYLNFVIFINLFVMYCGFILSRKIT